MTAKTDENTEAEKTAEAATAEDVKTAQAVKTAEAADAGDGLDAVDELDEQGDLDDLDELEAADEVPAASSGVGAGAAAVVSAALGLAALSGTWVGKVGSERETLIGQIKAQGGTAAQQISEIYGDAWHTTALVNGLFSLLALITAVVVLTRPQRPVWIRAVAVAGAVLGGIGLFLSAGMYFDLFLSLPSAP
ncbi:hypothetical protein [Streptomyces sp. NBC_01353]|uniref:hypothetical protein n=1 Tax=Streptomyces sp. NBC_01353 TaxID=2903835 RepID=UPI002E318962|nr:hypothetical protein [Streptomyces sp. NBC_01353]